MEITLRREQVRRVDELAIHELGIPGVVLMENAGRNTAAVARRMMEDRAATRAVIFCGPGNNGGDGFVSARHLHNSGASVALYLAATRDRVGGDAAINLGVLERMALPVTEIDSVAGGVAAASQVLPGDVVVDALLGTGFTGVPRSPMAELIDAINAAEKAAVLAVDVPSGLDCDTGEARGSVVRADRTVTFVAAKIGFAAAKPFTGDVEVVDIGVPPELVQRLADEGPSL